MPTDLPKRTWVEIDPAALAHNARTARSQAGGAAVMAVVKADGYGHGIGAVTAALLDEVDAFGVATLEEALAVRVVAGDEAEIMVLGALLPDERAPALGAGLQVPVSGLDEAAAYSTLAMESGTRARCHLAVDTGMGRLGFLEGEFAAAAAEVANMEGLVVEGIATHFPSADEDPDATAAQIERFGKLLGATGLTPRWIHLANSAGVQGFGSAGGNMVRPGLMLYGASPLPGRDAELRPALEWKARITQVRDLPAGASISYGGSFVTDRATRVATVGVGYGDGYPRHLSGAGAEVLIGGRRCAVVGRVTMDMIMVDVTALEPRPFPGDTVTLIGVDGDERVTAAELAEMAGTIPWEIFTGISSRVARHPIC